MTQTGNGRHDDHYPSYSVRVDGLGRGKRRQMTLLMHKLPTASGVSVAIKTLSSISSLPPLTSLILSDKSGQLALSPLLFTMLRSGVILL